MKSYTKEIEIAEENFKNNRLKQLKNEIEYARSINQEFPNTNNINPFNLIQVLSISVLNARKCSQSQF